MSGNFFSNTLNGPAYGPKNLWLKPSGNRKFLMFNHTSSLSSNFIFRRDLSTKFLYLLCRNPILRECEGETQTLEWGLESPLGLPKLQISIAGVKTARLEVFFISFESYQSVDVENGLA